MAIISSVFRKKSLKYGLPFLFIVLGGSFGLKEFAQLRYQFSTTTTQLIRDDLKKGGIVMKKPGEVTLEGEYERIKTMDIDNWEQKRGPRPWEENFDE